MPASNSAGMPDGDVDVFLALVERHRTYMYNLALRLTGREQDAKDVVQESLLHAFVHLDRFEGRADLRTWLNRIVVNCALDHAASGRAEDVLLGRGDCRPVVVRNS